VLSTSRRARARRGTRVAAAVASAAVVATMAPALLLSSPSDAASPRAATPAAADTSAFTPTSTRPQAQLAGHTRRVNPSAYRAFTLDSSGLDQLLDAAPDEAARGAAPATLQLPAPNGELVTFEVVESSVMESGLAAAHPEIKTYAGRSADGRATVRLDVTPMGFHAFVRGPRGGDAWFIDPAYNGEDSLYLSYLGDDLSAPERGLVEPDLADVTASEGLAPQAGENPGDAVKLRTYRLALTTDPSYATYFGTANVLAEKVTLVNRVNEVYNDDLAIRLVLINDSDRLNLDTAAKATGANGPCGAAACFTAGQLASCGGGSLGANRIALGQLVGADNYDIGHLGLGVNGGGVASLGVVGGNSKAQGCTGLPRPEGDFYAIDYVAHEMGHQFAGPHTFNGTQLNCSGGNRSAAASVEPGSGTSVMAYAGICEQDNLQPHSDPYFSQRSQTNITAYVTSTLNPVNEVQTVSLYGFDGADAITLTFMGQTTAPIPAGSTSAQIDTALEALPAIGANGVAVTGYANSNTAPALVNGIQVTFNGTGLAGLDQPALSVSTSAGDVTGFVGTTAQGGPAANGGSTVVTTANHAPTATAPADRTIPIRTPFTLTGSAVDADDDSMVYLWEQNDRGGATGTGLVNNTKPNGPLFRVFGTYANVTPAGTVLIHSPGENLAGGDPSRTFPDIDQVLTNNTNAETGTCPAAPAAPAAVPVPTIECYAEFLPTADYVGDALANNDNPAALDFRFTARDLDPVAGGYSFDDVKLALDKTAGPFLVGSRNTGTPAAAVAGRTEPIVWTVANTAGLAPNVKISLSTDGGHTYPYVLAASTPNDGTQNITWPNIQSDHARLRIEAVDNYFFDVNNLDFAMLPALLVTGTAAPSYSIQYSDGPASPITLSAESGRRSGPGLSATATGLPAGLALTETDTSGATGPLTSTFSVTGATTAAPGSYPVTVHVTDGTDSEDKAFTIVVTEEDATATYTGPATVEAPIGGNDVVSVPLSVHVTQAADGQDGDLTEATVTIKDTIANETLCADLPVDAGGNASCTYSADIPLHSGRTYDLQLQVGGRYVGQGAGTLNVTLDQTDPNTTITSGPAEGSLLLATMAALGFSSNESPVTYTCTLDGAPQSCPSSPASLGGLSARTHRFTVAATDRAGNTDKTPASRIFTVPMDDAALASTKGKWARGGNAGAFVGTVSSSKKKGSTLSTTVTGATSLSLIASTGKKGGIVSVYLNGQLLQTISLKGPAASQVVIPVATFASGQSGTVTIFNQTKKAKKKSKQKSVVIDGLGVVTLP
jgi:Metallo-peptidase family M12B Reprolysin-like